MRFFLLFFGLLSLLSCNPDNNLILVSNYGEAQGSYYHIKYLSAKGEDFHIQIDSILLAIDNSLSIYKSNSLISRLNNQEKIPTDAMFNRVFVAAKQVYTETNGYFDCSVMPIVEKLGFYASHQNDSIQIDSLAFKQFLPLIGFNKISLNKHQLTLPQGMRIDFNAIAQGFTVDYIAQFLASKGIQHYLIEVGGEVIAKGKNADQEIWKIGIDKPTEETELSGQFQCIIKLENKALATSGNYRKFFEKDGIKYAHTINPFSGMPAMNRLLSATVIHKSCMMADAYATAFMAMGLKKTKQFVATHPEIEVYLVFTGKDGNWQTYASEKLQESIIN